MYVELGRYGFSASVARSLREMVRYKARNEKSFAATEGCVGHDIDACTHSAFKRCRILLNLHVHCQPCSRYTALPSPN